MINNLAPFKQFNEAVKSKRELKKISMFYAAQEIGISKATLSRIENGSVPDLETYYECCKWLGCDMNKYLPLYIKEIEAKKLSQDAVKALVTVAVGSLLFIIGHYYFVKH